MNIIVWTYKSVVIMTVTMVRDAARRQKRVVRSLLLVFFENFSLSFDCDREEVKYIKE